MNVPITKTQASSNEREREKRKNGNQNMKCVQTKVMTTVKSNSEKLIDLSAVSIEKIDFHLRNHFQFNSLF